MEEWPERYRDLALAWMDSQWNTPSRSDYYLMRIAQRVQQQYSKKPISLKDQIVQFETAKSLSMEDRVARSKAIWMGGIKAYQRQALEKQRRGN